MPRLTHRPGLLYLLGLRGFGAADSLHPGFGAFGFSFQAGHGQDVGKDPLGIFQVEVAQI